MEIVERARIEGWTDQEVVDRIRGGQTELYELIMRRYNQRIYRVVRAILRDDGESEDVMQDAYVRAYQHLDQFEGRALFSTWLTRIAVHEALARVKKRNRLQQIDSDMEEGENFVNVLSAGGDPEQNTSRAQLRQMLEEAIMNLPDQYRTVVMLRDVEEMSTSEAAEATGLSEENVKVRLHRGRSLIREELMSRVGAEAKGAFPFMGLRCDRVVQGVLERIGSGEKSSSN